MNIEGVMGKKPLVIPEADVIQWMKKHKKSGWMVNYSMEAQRDADMEWFQAQRIRDQVETQRLVEVARGAGRADGYNEGLEQVEEIFKEIEKIPEAMQPPRMIPEYLYQALKSKYIKGGK